jgi:hypothetical protein
MNDSGGGGDGGDDEHDVLPSSSANMLSRLASFIAERFKNGPQPRCS